MGTHVIEVESVGGYKMYTAISAKDGLQYQLALRQIRQSVKGKTRQDLVKAGFFDNPFEARDDVGIPIMFAVYEPPAEVA